MTAGGGQAYSVARAALITCEGQDAQAPRDSAQALAIVRAECTTVETQQRAFDALQFKIEMLWVMIDAIDHAYRA